MSLLAASAVLSPKLVSLHDFAFGCRCLSPKSPFMISLLAAAAALSAMAAAAALSPKFVSLHDFAFGCRRRLVCEACLPSWRRFWLPLPPCLPSLSPFMISLLAASAGLSSSLSPFVISLLAAAPKLVSLHDFAFGCRCGLVSQACLPS